MTLALQSPAWQPAHTPALADTIHEAQPHDTAADVRRIDRELQLAYARGASDAELQALWAIRRGLLDAPSGAAHPVRI